MGRTTFFSLFFLVFLVGVNSELTPTKKCELPKALKNEILGYRSFVEKITEIATTGPYAGKLYDDLAEFIDIFGNRLAGTENLENSIKYLMNKTAGSGLKSHLERFVIPSWIRGKESARLVFPREKELKILGLGSSPCTSASGITADVIVVSSFDELKKKQKEVPGKIVLFNPMFTTYSQTVKYRRLGPSTASKLGAVAALVRSITPFSIYSPHTGSTSFRKEKPIPAASVTLEDADMIARMSKAGQRVVVHLKMEEKGTGETKTNNLIFDLEGNSLPQHYVTLSAHIDSWDVGEGALDDGGGAFLAVHSLLLLKFLKVPPPKRTIRGILWSAEEEGLLGAYAYLEKHREELKNWSVAMESDGGLYKPLGLNFNGTSAASCIVKEIASLFTKLNATTLKESRAVGSDISVFQTFGVPLLEPLHGPSNYMWFHHTDGDSLRTLDSSDIDKNLALFAATTYILANLSIPLPRETVQLNGRTDFKQIGPSYSGIPFVRPPKRTNYTIPKHYRTSKN